MKMSAQSEPRIGDTKQRPRTDAFLRALAHLVLRAFYRRIEIVGSDHFPKSGPVIVVANHFNSLVDGAVLTGFLPRMPRFLGASTLWDYRPLRPVLNAAGVVPLFRRQDGRGDQKALSATFAQAAELLHAGGVLAVFPEGLSHNEPGILPLKSGTARIALEAERDWGPLAVQIVPVALTFEAKNKFRSRTLVEIGPPVGVHPDQTESYQSPDTGERSSAAKALTGQIQECLEALTPSHETWDDSRLLGRAVEMLAPAQPVDNPDRALSEAMTRRRALRQRYIEVRDSDPDRAAQIRRDLREYDRMLHVAELGDAEVAHIASGYSAARVITRALMFFAIRLPVSLIGLILNWPAYRVLLTLSRRKDLDKRSTWSIFGGLFVFPLYWCLVATASGYFAATTWGARAGWIIGVAVLIIAPISGSVLLTARDLYFEISSALRAWRKLRAPSRFNKALLQKRNNVLKQLQSLATEKSTDQTARDA